MIEAWLVLHGLLLRLAPRRFRARFGAELLDVTRRSLDAAHHERGRVGCFVVGVRHAADLTLNVARLNLEAPAMHKTLLLLPFVVLAAAGTGWIDTHAEAVQPAVLLLIVGAAVPSFLDPRRAWLWWLLLGLSVPTAHLVARAQGWTLPYEVDPSGSTFLALIPAGIGALLGLGLAAAARRRPRAA